LRKPVSIILTLTLYYQDHDPEQSSKSFSRWSLFIKKLLIKNMCAYAYVDFPLSEIPPYSILLTA